MLTQNEIPEYVCGPPYGPREVRKALATKAKQVRNSVGAAQSVRSTRTTEDLVALALEMSSSLSLNDLVSNLAMRAARLLDARSSAVGLCHQGRGRGLVEALVLRDPDHGDDAPSRRALGEHLSAYAATRTDSLYVGSTESLLSGAIKARFGWDSIVLARLTGTGGELLGFLCLADCRQELTPDNLQLLHAISAHASTALENSRLFSRIAQSNRQWASLFDSISDCLVVHDEQHLITRVNRPMADLAGMAPSKLMGAHCGKLLQSDRSLCPFCEVGRDVHEFTYPGSRRSYLLSTSRIQGAASEGSQTAHILTDVTDWREAERQLERQRDFNTQILNNTQSMILVVDTAGLISYANRRCYEASNFREGAFVGRQLRDFLMGPDQKAWDTAFEAVLRGDSAGNLEFQIVISGGQQKRFSANLSPMRGEQEDVSSVVIAMTDITEVAAIQAKLMQTEKMAAVGQLVSGVAHEVNNPLTAIMGFADLMLENPALPTSCHEDLRVILHEAQRTKEIVQNLLSFARQAPRQRQAVDVNTVLRKTLALRSYDLSSRHVEVIEQFDETLPPVMGDAHQLQQVFLNILNNAYDAVQETNRPGRLEIQTRTDAGGAEIVFRDSGPGIKQADRIFDPFFTTKEVGKGTGLGLSICYGIVRQHGGEITCHNNVAAPGASFIIKLPLAGHVARLAEQLTEGGKV